MNCHVIVGRDLTPIVIYYHCRDMFPLDELQYGDNACSGENEQLM